ncbi:MAG: SH3 domain-containing protein [Brevinematales bacterium]|nr:SH3 domain-containing protein [Brevinematales bacterium]
MKVKNFLILFFLFFPFAFAGAHYYKMVIAENGLVLRERPDINSKKITLIPYGTKVKVIEYSRKYDVIENTKACWVKVVYKNLVGWVFDGFLFELNMYDIDENFLFYATKFSILLGKNKIIKNKKVSYVYDFNYLGILPEDPDYIIEQNYSGEDVLITNSLYYKAIISGSETKNLYVVNEKFEFIIVSNYKIHLINNGMYYYPVIRFISEKNFESYTNLFLMKKEAFDDYTNRHKFKKKKIEVLKEYIPLKNFEYDEILYQAKADLNGDNSLELISYVTKTYILNSSDPVYGKVEASSIVVTFDDSSHLELFSHKYVGFNGLILIPFHNSLAIRASYSSFNSGDSGEYLILFDRKYEKPIYIFIDPTRSF